MKLHQLKTLKTTTKKKRVGRGSGTGKGTYSGRGMNGQKSRSGYKLASSLPYIAKLPKLRGQGFRKVSRGVVKIVNLSQLNSAYKKGETVSLESLLIKGLVQQKKSERIKSVKILGKGKLTQKLKFDEKLLFSKKALDARNVS